MARIRTIKPDFFRHEGLQALQEEHVRLHPMLVFAGLWGHCDKAGRFLWRPKMLKLDILPFLNFKMAESLELLAARGFVKRYSVEGIQYGWIPSFQNHQRIHGREAEDPEKYPEPSDGNIVETPEQNAETAAGESGGQELSSGTDLQGTDNPELTLGIAQPAKKINGAKILRQQAAEIITFLNQRAGRNFAAKGANLEFVVARLKDGETPDDCRAVIAMKVREWKGDPKATTWLRPETLFNRTKFASYKGQLAS